ncbi:dihydroneopterin aldolase [Bacillus sp. FJAT-27245]|uniref:dihydroneopterin aldolase n=1 Tax=Bacillus sp. FJAT-27245 TaxID=1684144 RepID=UPI0006A784AF|nr:dihydroneopterin aldolase [Bacillus sp. FJAT-27245]
MDKIHVNKMEFYGYHGVFPEETKLGQRFIIELAVGLDLRKAGETDDLEASVNYADLYRISREVVEGKPYKLIEAVAEKIASRIFEEFPLVEETTVKVVKPDPPIPGHYESVAAEITRRR